MYDFTRSVAVTVFVLLTFALQLFVLVLSLEAEVVGAIAFCV